MTGDSRVIANHKTIPKSTFYLLFQNNRGIYVTESSKRSKLILSSLQRSIALCNNSFGLIFSSSIFLINTNFLYLFDMGTGICVSMFMYALRIRGGIKRSHQDNFDISPSMVSSTL